MLNHSKVKKDKNVEKKDLYIEIEEAILRKDGQTIRELSAVITSMWIENSKLALQLIK
ncbi:hypothetical protein DSAG12_00181 [Promethearchaeum syntrophicum]|uniref:Uncharacterized protein n=1 Tax=Promethearchaeum syntrophicum TaxID=2594042 RepID=A0A5B9D5H8_9ARCH|nr:hypothetical protein [Candidatus Prometheoarchaeum syntrophicum]